MKTLIKDALLLDANREYEKRDVLIEDELISEIAETIDAAGADRIIELRGNTLLPGFIDSHIHVVNDQKGFHDRGLLAWAYNGQTTIRELGILRIFELDDYLAWLKEHQGAQYPHVVTTGKYIAVEGGYGARSGMIIETAEQAVAGVEFMHERGCPGIKIGYADGGVGGDGPKMAPEIVKALCAAAAERGMFVTAHLTKARSLDILIDCGINEAAHTPDDEIPTDVLKKMVDKNVAMVTTVGDPSLPPANFLLNPPGSTKPLDAIDYALARNIGIATMLKNLREFYKLGGTIAVGTDLLRSSDYIRDARIPVIELKHLSAIGMSLREVVAAATINGARLCRTDKTEGSIDVGKKANLISIPGKLDDFDKLLEPSMVINRGVRIRG